MKKLLLIVALAALFTVTATAERWLLYPVVITTNETSITLDGRFSQPAVLEGFTFYQVPSLYTNSVAMTWTSIKHPFDYLTYPLHSDTITNEVLDVSDLDRLVFVGDRLIFTNDVVQGTLLLRFKME